MANTHMFYYLFFRMYACFFRVIRTNAYFAAYFFPLDKNTEMGVCMIFFKVEKCTKIVNHDSYYIKVYI